MLASSTWIETMNSNVFASPQLQVTAFLKRMAVLMLFWTPFLLRGQTNGNAISREVSIFNFGSPGASIEAISREVSVFNKGNYSLDAVSREVSVFNYGPNHLDLTIGTTALRAGDSGGVPVTLFSLAPITNLQFAFDFPSNLLGNWSAQPIQSSGGNAAVSNNSRVYVTFVPTNQAFFKTQVLGQVNFTAIPNQPSAFLPLNIAAAAGPRPDGSDSPVQTYHDGEVAVIRTNPLLRIYGGSSGAESLTLYGLPGTNYSIEFATNLNPPVAWSPAVGVNLTNFIFTTGNLGSSNAAAFFRAKQQ
jgi:hypothetical protein